MLSSKRFVVFLLSTVMALCLAPGLAFGASYEQPHSDLAAGNIKAQSDLKAADTTANPSLSVRGLSQGKGWKAWKQSGKTVGLSTTRLQGLRVKIDTDGLSGSISYRVNTYSKGWQKWVNNGKPAGIKGYAIMGVQIKLTGDIAEQFDVVYRVNHAERGWLPWAMNGRTSGMVSKSAGINQIQIKLVPKGSYQPIADGAYAIGIAKNAKAALAVPKSKRTSGLQMMALNYTGSELKERFYVRNESDGTVSIQSVVSGKFLCEENGAIVQRPDSSDPSYRWVLEAWDAGYVIKNAATGNNIELSGEQAVAGTSGARWTFSNVGMIADANYLVVNKAHDNVLDLEGMSYNDKANVRVIGEGDSQTGAHVFTFYHKGADVYRIDNVSSCKPIGVAGGSGADGANVEQAKWKSANAQKWVASLDRTGDLTFTNVASGKVLTAASNGKSNANVVSSSDTGSAAQRWSLEPSSYEGNPGLVRAIQKAKNMSSSTRYLIMVDLTNHWLTIFKGKSGKWAMYKNWQISCGSSNHPTVTGNFTVQSRGYSFGEGYTCYYWTQFHGDYLFHSIKYHEGTFTVKDGRLGKSISMGCVRMSLGNAKWIYNNIPSGTRVRIYK